MRKDDILVYTHSIKAGPIIGVYELENDILEILDRVRKGCKTEVSVKKVSDDELKVTIKAYPPEEEKVEEKAERVCAHENCDCECPPRTLADLFDKTTEVSAVLNDELKQLRVLASLHRENIISDNSFFDTFLMYLGAIKTTLELSGKFHCTDNDLKSIKASGAICYDKLVGRFIADASH